MMRKLVLIAIFTAAAGLLLIRQGRVAGAATDQAGKIVGLVIPHYTLAREASVQAIQKIAREKKYQRIVVLSPNHFRPNSYTFTSARALVDFPIDTETVDSLAGADRQMVIDQTLIEHDHGLTIPMNYLRAAFPEARFVPILVAPFFGEENLRAWAARLARVGDEETLYVVSVDMAHDLGEQAAYAKDQETAAAMAGFDYRKIFEFKDDHLDNPGGVATLLMIMENKGAKTWEQWDRGHGATVLGDPVVKGTSFVIGVFRESDN